MAEWLAPVPLSDDPPVALPPSEDCHEKVIEAYPVINLEEGVGDDDDLERIDDPRGIRDHQND